MRLSKLFRHLFVALISILIISFYYIGTISTSNQIVGRNNLINQTSSLYESDANINCGYNYSILAKENSTAVLSDSVDNGQKSITVDYSYSVNNLTTENRLQGMVVVLDPGHQMKANHELEPLFPGSTEMKAKCSSGTSGIATHRPEYEVVLEICLLLRDFLEKQGCQVFMTRTSNDVNISNIERAQFALSKKPDVFLRLHCDGSKDTTQNGVAVFIADKGIFKEQLPSLACSLRDNICIATGSKARGVNASSNYTGLNWATDIPSFLLEMGFMTNPEEDKKLSDLEYQEKICQGIAEFLSLIND